MAFVPPVERLWESMLESTKAKAHSTNQHVHLLIFVCGTEGSKLRMSSVSYYSFLSHLAVKLSGVLTWAMNKTAPYHYCFREISENTYCGTKSQKRRLTLSTRHLKLFTILSLCHTTEIMTGDHCAQVLAWNDGHFIKFLLVFTAVNWPPTHSCIN